MAVTGMAEAGERAATALLGSHGVEVKLRVPTFAATGDDAEQMGLATPGFDEVPLGRGVFRKANSTRVLLLAASAVTQALATEGSASAEAMFAGAAGVVVGEALYRIEACEAMRAGDGVYGYALTLAAPAQ